MTVGPGSVPGPTARLRHNFLEVVAMERSLGHDFLEVVPTEESEGDDGQRRDSGAAGAGHVQIGYE
jgi:hypothetical protein